MKCSGEKPPTAQFWPVFPFNADFKCHLCITTFNVRLSCSEGRDNLLALIIKGNQSKEKEKRDEKSCRYSRFQLPGCFVRDGADRNVLIFNRADVFLFPAFSLCLCITNKCYNRSCRDYFSADRKPVRKRACRWQAFAFLCLLRNVQWNARLCAFSEMQHSVSGVNTKGKTRVFFPGKDGSGLLISRALLHVRAPLPADGRRTLLQLHSGLFQLIFHIQILLVFVLA